MDPVTSVQNNNFSGNTKELAKVLGARIGNLKSFIPTILWNSAKLVKIFPGIIVRRHHTDRKQMGLLKDSVVTADHKMQSGESESRNNHRYAVVVQDFGNTVVTILPTQNKNFSGHPEEPTEVPGADKETKSHLH